MASARVSDPTRTTGPATGATARIAAVADVARRLILVTLFDNRTPIGLVRLKLKPVVEELTAHLDRAFTRARESGTTQPNILAGASDEIDELFNW